MAKTLNELAGELKEYIIDQQSDAHNRGNLRVERYNNLKLDMNIAKNPIPHVIISMSMSSAEFDLKSGEKNTGSLGPDEKYVLRWLAKTNTIPALNECWKYSLGNRGRITDKKFVDKKEQNP